MPSVLWSTAGGWISAEARHKVCVPEAEEPTATVRFCGKLCHYQRLGLALREKKPIFCTCPTKLFSLSRYFETANS